MHAIVNVNSPDNDVATTALREEIRPSKIGLSRSVLFSAGAFLGSFLLFMMEPMIARMAMPRVGGAPAVWNSAMLVYQTLLLAGYGYAHAIAGWSGRRQAQMHIAVLLVAAGWLPIGLKLGAMPADAQPALWVPLLLLVSIGPLFFAIAAQAPLLQRWHAIASSDCNPYSLYVASNLGSFSGLIAYPIVIEPLLGVAEQRLLWSLLYGFVAALLFCCALTLRHNRDVPLQNGKTARPEMATRLAWVLPAGVASGLMLSTTTHLTTNVIALPMIWIVPLGLYLLSFSLAFSGSRWSRWVALLFPMAMVVGAGVSCASGTASPFQRGSGELAMFFIVATTLHRFLYQTRPDSDQLTSFYLHVSLGGVLGGLFCGLVAPLAFDWTYEHPLLLIAAGLLIVQQPLLPSLAIKLRGTPRIGLWVVAALLPLLALPTMPHHVAAMSIVAFLLALGALCAADQPGLFTLCIAGILLAKGGWSTLAISWDGQHRARSYFGVSEINDERGIRSLTHGITVHGTQRLKTSEQLWPLSYYAPRSGVGRVMEAAPLLFGAHARIGVVGLGAGTLACYARPGQQWIFFEIDPAVIAMATDPTKFTFLSRCAPHAPIVRGDARISLATRRYAPFDLLVIDAFSSDTPPLHLMTSEAFDLYRDRLAPHGVILVNISNRFIDFGPELAAIAQKKGWSVRLVDYQPDADRSALGVSRSVWIALAPDGKALSRIPDQKMFEPMAAPVTVSPWTDDKASIIPAMRIFR